MTKNAHILALNSIAMTVIAALLGLFISEDAERRLCLDMSSTSKLALPAMQICTLTFHTLTAFKLSRGAQIASMITFETRTVS